jgi:3-hydroxy-9,10-secoandrosta-1,3,5(10)-triene-9,17-dione monooxygenase reductase component
MAGRVSAARSTPPGDAVDPTAFRALISRWGSGVSVVTAREEGHDGGLTVNALLSVSLQPPTLLVSLTHDADSTPVILRTRRFVVNLLSATQRSLSERFALAIPGPEKFSGVPVHRRADGPARLDGALASFECEVAETFAVADHQLILGRVVDLETGPDGLPLLFYRSRYGEPSGPDSLTLPPGRR